MAFKETDPVTKDKKTMDFILRRWNKKDSQDNRTVLAAGIDEFRQNLDNRPWSFSGFYTFADSTGLRGRLADTSDGGRGPGASGMDSAGLSAADAPAVGGKAVRIMGLVLVILAVLVVLALLWHFTVGFTGSSSRGSAAASGALAGQAVDGTAGSAEFDPLLDDPDSVPVELVSHEQAEADLDRTVSLSGLPRDALIIYFEPDVYNRLEAAEDIKLVRLISALQLFTAGSLTVTGHAASIGYPQGERYVSESRSRFIASRLRAAGISANITLRTTGEGATRMITDEDIERARQLSRRIEVTVP